MKTRNILLLIGWLLSMNAGVYSPGVASPLAQISAHAGFPKTDPGTVDFAGPAVVDINGDGRLDVLVADSGGCVWGFDPQGNRTPNFPIAPSGGCGSRNRINSFAVGELDGDSRPEILLGTAGTGNVSGRRGKIYAYHHNGSQLSGWPKEMAWNSNYGNGQAEVYSVALADVNGGGNHEAIAGTSNNASNGGSVTDPTPNLYVWNSGGNVLSGYPTGYRRAGIYGLVAAGNLTGDGKFEVVAARDHRWLHAYNASGRYLPGWPVETFVDPARTSGAPYVEFTRNAPALGDIDGDGKVEIVAAGRVKQAESTTGGQTVITNNAVMVFEPDGSRSPGWTVAKLGDRAPLVNNYAPSQAPALADLNSDGKLEIIVTLMDGTARAYRHDGTQRWKYDFAQGAKLFASEPVVGDITGDGRLDVVFGLYSPDGTANNRVGIVALDADGRLISGYPLALTRETNSSKQGVRAAPALADFDGDGKVEILAGSWSGTLYVWDLTATYNASKMPWPTGRGSNTRAGWYVR